MHDSECPVRSLDVSKPCVRETLSAFVPLVYVVACVIVRGIQWIAPSFTALFSHYLSPEEAVRILSDDKKKEGVPRNKPLHHVTMAWLTISTFESAIWLTIASYSLFLGHTFSIRYLAFSISWLYAVVKTFQHRDFPPMQLMFLFSLHFAGAMFMFIGDFYFTIVYGVDPPRRAELLCLAFNVLATAILVLSGLGSPLEPQSSTPKGDETDAEVTPEESTSVWGWATFSWATPLILEGRRRMLNEGDIYDLTNTMRSQPLFSKFDEFDPSTSLLWRLFRANSSDLILDFFGTILSVLCNYSTPFFLKQLLDEISSGYPYGRGRAYVFAFLMFGFKMLKSEIDLQRLYRGRRAAIRMWSQLKSMVFLKALKRKDVKAPAKTSDASTSADTGKVMNIMSQDSGRISTAVTTMSLLYGAPLEIVIACTFLSQLLGVAVLVGLAVLIICWPLNTVFAHLALRIKLNQFSARDTRMNTLNELLASIKLVKFFAWEEQWASRVLEARSVELRYLAQHRVLKVLLELLWDAVPVAISVLTFYAYVAQGNELTIGTTFAALALFNMLKNPLSVLSTRIMEIIQAYVSLKRIEEFLNEEEVDAHASSIIAKECTEEYVEGIELQDASFAWNQNKRSHSDGVDEQGAFRLSDISISFPMGKLSVITGPTASGKTALLLALLGEMTTLPGTKLPFFKNADDVEEVSGLHNSVSYAAQVSWLQHKSIKENILFGNEYEESRYKAVVEACALFPDFTILEDGDETEIGTRGVTLSGGQKSRVALARAVYAPSKIVILDDPLSAVDAHTAKHLVEMLFKGPLMENRTVVLVTHHLELVLPAAAYVVHLKDGRVETRGLIDDMKQECELEAVVKEAQEADIDSTSVGAEAERNEGQNAKIASKVTTVTEEGKKETPRKLVEAEHRDEGRVKIRTIKSYLKASAIWPFILLIVAVICMQGAGVLEKLWIKVWTEAYEGRASLFLAEYLHLPRTYLPGLFALYVPLNPSPTPKSADLPSANDDPFFFVGIYALIGLASLLFTLLAAAFTYIGALIAANRLFKALLASITQATMHWYDVTPVGRIMNRFSKDIEKVDGTLATSVQHVTTTFVGFIFSILVVVSVSPAFLIPAVIIGLLYAKIGSAYLSTTRDIRRMESISRSPVFAFFDETLEGVVTVRAFSAEKWFLKSLWEKVDLTLKMNYAYWILNRWLLFRFDCLGTLSILITSLISISTKGQMAGWAALSITSAMTFTTNVFWLCRFWTLCELDLVAVERITEYLEIPHEQPGVIENSRPPAHWPTSSGPNAQRLLEVKNLEIKYSPELPSVLHDVSFTFKAGERVGIIGRTGSGKSTLAMSFLRFVEPTGGQVLIDGLDITSMGVRDLRSRVTFVPQEAVLFAGTIRENLNPFGEYDDAMCWDALKRVHLVADSFVLPPELILEDATQTGSGSERRASGAHAIGPINLDTEVSAGGKNFSVGQRQLLALARAILRRSAIVILDEATSSIDFDTDEKIQRTIREEFNSELLISIAHRLNTIIDYDRLLVLDAGRVVELDTPSNLINKEGGLFRELCLQSGQFDELERIANGRATNASQSRS